MSDFHQTGVVATLHRLGSSNGHKIERELERFGRQRPIALVLPALYSEFESDAMHGIIRELAEVKFLQSDCGEFGSCRRRSVRTSQGIPGSAAAKRAGDLERRTAPVSPLPHARGE